MAPNQDIIHAQRGSRLFIRVCNDWHTSDRRQITILQPSPDHYSLRQSGLVQVEVHI